MPNSPNARTRKAAGLLTLFLSVVIFGAGGTTAIAAPAPPTRPAITGIAHIALATNNMAAEREFYTHYLGWTAVASPEFPDGVRFYGDPRQTVEIHPASSPGQLPLDHVAFRTSDANGMRLYLKSKGIAVPDQVTTLRDGEKIFLVKDPEGNSIEFAQRGADSTGAAIRPASLPETTSGSISGRIIHAGFIVKSAAAEDHFYKDILGFHQYWQGGMKDGVVDWSSLQVPDGTDWVEYMLNASPTPSKRQIGVDDHFALGVAQMDTVVADFQTRGFPSDGQKAKQMGRDGKFQLNEYDPDGTRVEFMEFKPSQTPCCNPITGRTPSEAEQ